MFALHGQKQAGTVAAVDGTEEQEDGVAINAVQAGVQCRSHTVASEAASAEASVAASAAAIAAVSEGPAGRTARRPQGWPAGQRPFCTAEDP